MLIDFSGRVLSMTQACHSTHATYFHLRNFPPLLPLCIIKICLDSLEQRGADPLEQIGGGMQEEERKRKSQCVSSTRTTACFI